MTPTIHIVVLGGAFVSAAVLTYLLMRIGLRKGILDIPNDRSSHTSPVPRGGGLSIVITFFLFLLVYPSLVERSIEVDLLTALILGGGIVVAVGVLDDLSHVPAQWRFLAQLVAAVLSLGLLRSLPDISAFGIEVSLEYVVFILLVVSVVWCTNLFNFMDGIDGIAGIEAITVLGGGALILFVQGEHDWLMLLTVLSVCVAGFLVWNWAPAKVFMGDSCSGFLGFSIAVIAIATSTSGNINLWSWLILAGVFVVDSTTTLIVRVWRGEKWYAAHRSHAYQILARRYQSHQRVSIGVAALNVVWLLPLAVLAASYPYWAFAICVAALMPLAFVAISVGAGRPESCA